MARLEILWTKTALSQRNYIFEYWNFRNGNTTYSRKLNNKLKSRINLLKTNPELGKKTDFKNTRIISLIHYSILYQRIENQIIITGIWDNRQNPEKLIEYLKKEL